MVTSKRSLRAIHKDVIFQFEDESGEIFDGQRRAKGFKEKTNWGFMFVSAKESAGSPRWGRVVTAGPEVVDDISPGRRILIENLKWTEEVKFDGSSFWKTTEDHVLAVDESEDK